MRRVQIVLFAALAALAALVLVLTLRNRQPPYLPSDPEHDPAFGVGACLDCHGPEGALPRSANHPNGLDCLRCHASR